MYSHLIQSIRVPLAFVAERLLLIACEGKGEHRYREWSEHAYGLASPL